MSRPDRSIALLRAYGYARGPVFLETRGAFVRVTP
jgi:hypothetical protein